MSSDKPYSFDYPLSDEHLKAIGRITVEAAHTEAHLEYVIGNVLGLETDRIRAITVPLSMNQRLNLIYGLTLPYLSPSERTTFGNIIGELRAANNDRNDVIHAYWMDAPTGAIATKRTYDRGKVRFRWRADMTPNHLNKIAERLYTSWGKLVSFLYEVDVPNRQPYHNPFAVALASARTTELPDSPSLNAMVQILSRQKDPPQS